MKAANVIQKKETRSEIRKKTKRIQESRDNLKEKNREKSDIIKKLSDRLTEIQLSRDSWKKKCRKNVTKHREKKGELQKMIEKAVILQEKYNLLRKEVDSFKKK